MARRAVGVLLVHAALSSTASAYTFLPHGMGATPTGIAADAIVRLKSRRDVKVLGDAAPADILAESLAEDDGLQLFAVRGVDEDRLAAAGVEYFPVDAGPFPTAAAAALLCERWLEDFWQCHRLERSNGGENSCLEFGGCHRRCWWRGSIGRVELLLTVVAQHVENGEEASPALVRLRERAAADERRRSRDSSSLHEEKGEEEEVLTLRANLVSLGPSLHYASLRPTLLAARAQPRARPVQASIVVQAEEELEEAEEEVKAEGEEDGVVEEEEEGGEEVLSCQVKGFYPFAESIRTSDGLGGVLGWTFKDTHQAVYVRSSDKDAPVPVLRLDFMTEGGQSHPVWYNEAVKWHVFLGGDIRGEVRIRTLGGGTPGEAPRPGTKLARLRVYAAGYDRRMNLYTSNCRIFAARVRREVARLNAEEAPKGARAMARFAELAADARLAAAIVHAATLPALYPLAILAICWEGLKDL
jgi:hypothetical protein